MRILGRRAAKMLEFESARVEELHELELVADPETLRRLASFLVGAAAQMESKGAQFEHVHLLDAWSAHGSGVPDIVISRELSAGSRK
jgi:hypothetical protein